jgi:hypothetical protein
VVQQQATDAEISQQWAINYETHYPKKGQAAFFHFNFMYKSSWYYGWNFNQEGDCEYGEYMPMQWGGIASSVAGILKNHPIWYGRANNTIVLGFNEPDLSDQSNMPEATAAYQWPRLQRMRMPLGGPCPAGYKGTWRVAYEALAEEQGLRSEYMTMHWYFPGSAATGSPTTLINNMQTLYDLYGKKILLTEFSTRDFDGTKTTWSRNHNYNWLAEFMWRAESLTYLKRWSLYEWGYADGGGTVDTTDRNGEDVTGMNSPKLSMHYTNDKTDPGYEDLMECGLLMAGWDGDATVRDNKPYIIHNKGRFRRLIDNPVSSSIGHADVTNTEQTEQFVLKVASSGTKYIEGLSTGRRLSYNGSSVGLADAGTTGSSVEWELNEYQYGWYYIIHSTGVRLRINDWNVINVAPSGTTGDNVCFRFIVPAQEFEVPDEADGNVLVGYDFDASSSYPLTATMLSSVVTASSLSSPMDVATVSTVGDNSGVDATGVAFGSTDELGCLGISVDDTDASSFAEAVAGDNYMSFTVTPGDDRTLTLSSISFKAIKKASTSVDEYAITDASGNLIGNAVQISQETTSDLIETYESVVVDLTGTAYETVTAATEFRIYAWGRGTTSTGGTLATIDKLVLRGTAGPILVGYDFDEGTAEATEVVSPLVTATALTSPMDIGFVTTIGDNSGVDAEGLTFGNSGTLGCVGIGVNDATTSSFADAVAGDDYVTFTVTPDGQVTLDLDAITFKASTTQSTSVDEYAVTDEAGNLIGSPVTISTIGQSTTYQSVSVDLSGSEYQSMTEPVTFRIYAWGRETTATGGTLAMIDKVTLHGDVTFNTTPKAIPQIVETLRNADLDITLTGSDVEGDSLSYSVLADTANGTLSGTAPNLTYTPTSGYVGEDRFTFTVSDGQTTSAEASVSILVGIGSDVIAGYDFDDGTSNATTVVTVENDLVTASDYGVGAGLIDTIANDGNCLSEDTDAEGYVFGTANPFSYGGARDTFGFTDMNNADNLGLAISNNDYMVFTITPDGGYELDLTSFTFRTFAKTTDHAAERWALFSSVDGFAEGDQIAVGQTTVEATYVDNVIDLSEAGLQGLSNSIAFRLYIYGGNQSWSAATQFDKVIVHGSVNVIAQTGYESWVADYGLTGDDALTSADAEHDGIGDGYNNLAEYALGMDPTISDAGSRDWINVTNEGGTNWFDLVHYRRWNYEAEGLSYWLIGFSNLLDSATSTNAQDDILVGPEDNGYEPVTNRYEIDDSAMFINLQIRKD